MSPAAKNNTPVSAATYIRTTRHKRHFTQAGLAEALTNAGHPVSASTVAHWESDKAPSAPPIEKPLFVQAWATVFGIETTAVYRAFGILGAPDDLISRILAGVEQLDAVGQKLILEMIRQLRGENIGN